MSGYSELSRLIAKAPVTGFARGSWVAAGVVAELVAGPRATRAAPGKIS